MSKAAKIFPVALTVIMAVWLLGKTRLPKDAEAEMRIAEYGRLPVLFQGRVKPLDTHARNSLIVISDKQTWQDDAGNERLATEWLLDVMAQTPAAFSNQVFRIPNRQVIDLLKLDPERKRFRYSLSEFVNEIQQIDQEANRARQVDPKNRDVFDNQILDIANKLHLYMRIQESHRFVVTEDMNALHQQIQRYQSFEEFPLPHTVPPANGQDWQTFTRAGFSRMINPEPHPYYLPMARLLYSYGEGNVEEFNDALVDYQATLKKFPPPDQGKFGYEVFFNNFSPFMKASSIYVLVFILSAFAWLFWTKPLNRAAFFLIILAFVVHTWALISRIYISGYPPVTNLYSSAIFIGWGCVILGIILEATFKIGVGNLIAAVSGFLTLLVAHFLAGDGDTMEVMQAVLDTKFWLATHVTTISLGYTATFFAGGIGIYYILTGLLTKRLDLKMEATLSRMIYGIVCFGLLLSFVGTVLGGLWADDSWGRFWGWDPKENGALMIVLWNGLILHARWGAIVQARGLAVLAVFGNIITAWSWFGVNQLSIGLHSYGFTSSAAFWLLVFVAFNMLIIAAGLIPVRNWRSQRSLPHLTKG